MRIFLLIFLVLAASLHAQTDPMAMQRCIWSCLANSPGAQSYQYEQCVAQYCVPNIPQQGSAWSSGVATDGVHRFATTQAEQGMAFTYFCTTEQSYFVLADVPVSANPYRFLIGQTDYIVTLDLSRGVLSASIPHNHAFTQAVRRGGDWLTIRDMRGGHVIRFSLLGADQHIGAAVNACLAG